MGLTLPKSLETWLTVKIVLLAFSKLEAQHLGQHLNKVMDDSLSREKSDPIQKPLAKWLRQVAEELET